MMTKTKATVHFQHFDEHGNIREISETNRTVYTTKNGHHINYLGSTRTVTPRGADFVAFGSRRIVLSPGAQAMNDFIKGRRPLHG